MTWTRPSGDRELLVVCQNGHVSSLGRNLRAGIHHVADDGTLSPSYICPYENCGCHDWLKIEGWRP